MCGIIAALLANPNQHVNQQLYDGLTVLQHRGQDAAGIMTCHKNRLYLRKDNGLVRDVFQQKHMEYLLGSMGIGHVRYPTAGSSSSSEAQPFYSNSPYGIALAHNGNLTNKTELVEQLANRNFRHVNTDSDSELLLNVLADEILKQNNHPLQPEQIFDAVSGLYNRSRGGYTVVALINGHGILAFRDPHGIRPLVFGTRTTCYGTDYCFSSESVALDALGFQLVRDVMPGEAIFIKSGGILHSRVCAPKELIQLSPCIFEHVYFARPDSTIDGVSVYHARLNMGRKLALKIQREYPTQFDIDVVIPIPDTSRTSALQVALTLGIPYREGFVKNRYIARTFIMPGQVVRKKTVKLKLNAIRSEFKGKNVLLVDDSIVRGTTSRQIVQIAREAGATNVYFASAAPAIRYPNVYGIDMPSREELIAHGRDEKMIAAELGADWVMYQDLVDLEASVTEINTLLTSFDSSCFNGKYVTGDIDEQYFAQLQRERNDSVMAALKQGMSRTFSDPDFGETIDMHNDQTS